MALNWRAWFTRKRVVIGVLVVAALGVAYLGYSGIRAWIAWRNIERVEFDLEASRAALGTWVTTTIPGGTTTIPGVTTTTLPPLLDDDYGAYLAIGSDERPPEESDAHPGIYADAVVLYLEPRDGDPLLVSIPRDLLVTNPCTGEEVKLNSLLAGCETVSGPELIAIAVEDLTGIAVDHFAIVRFDGLVGVIDGIGGIDLCVPRALRESGVDLLPEGCSRASGYTVLRFVTSRLTEELVDGEWRFQEGVSALTRSQRHQEVLLALLSAAKRLRTPGDLADLITDLGDGALVLDETLSMPSAIDLAWRLRGTPASSIRQLVLPVEATVTRDGRFALRATMPFVEVIAQAP